MIDDIAKALKADTAEAEVLMPVFVRAQRVLAVIDMEDCDLILADDAVKLFHHSRKVILHIITGIVGMAGIKTDPEPMIVFHSVINARQLFKAPADLRSLSRHGLQSDMDAAVFLKHLVESLDDLRDTGVHSRAHMRAGMKDQGVAVHRFCPLDLQPEKIHRQLKRLRLYGIGKVNDVRRMDHKLLNAILLHQSKPFLDPKLLHRFSAGILRRARIYHKCIGPVGYGFLHGTQKHFLPAHTHVASQF